jgi:hypothetical protein
VRSGKGNDANDALKRRGRIRWWDQGSDGKKGKDGMRGSVRKEVRGWERMAGVWMGNEADSANDANDARDVGGG